MFVDTYSPKLMGVCYRYCLDQSKAKDALQESLIQILNHMDRYDGIGNFNNWITTITINKCLEQMRKDKVRWTASMESIIDQGVEPASELKLEYKDVMQFIGNLPDNYRIALQMFLVEGFSHKEISEHLGISEGSSRSLVSRGRAMVQEAFEEPKSQDKSPKKGIIKRLKIALFF